MYETRKKNPGAVLSKGMLIRFTLFTALSIGLSTARPLFGQTHAIGSPAIQNYSKSEYKAGTQNWKIIQDEEGVLYFGNNKGVLVFDGNNWQTLSLPNRTIVRSLALGKEEKLYIGGQDEFGYLGRNHENEPSYISLVDQLPDSLRNFADVWEIIPIGSTVVFCTTPYLFFWDGSQVRWLKGEKDFQHFFQIHETLYVQDVEQSLLVLTDNKLEDWIEGHALGNAEIVALLPYSDSSILAISAHKGGLLVQGRQIRSWGAKVNDFLSQYSIYTAIRLHDGRYALGTTSSGLLLFSEDGSPSLHLSRVSGLQNNTILSLKQDQEGNLWLGLDNGIDHVAIHSPYYFIRSDSGVEGTGYTSIKHHDLFYIGTNQGLFWTEWDDQWNARFSLVPASQGQVWSLNLMDEHLLMGHHKGLFWIRGNEAVPLPSPLGVWKVIPLRQNTDLAVAGAYDGLYLYEKNKTGRLPWRLIKKLGGFDISARVMEQDRDGNIWISHPYKGLYQIRLTEDLREIERVRFFDEKDGLPGTLSINVALIRGEPVFTTQNGIFSYNAGQDSFFPDQELENILGKELYVNRLIEDEVGNIWFSIGSRFGMIDIESKGILNEVFLREFHYFQGELVDGFEHIFALNESSVFISTEKGAVHLDPGYKRMEKDTFQTLIRRVINTGTPDTVIFHGHIPGEKKREARFSRTLPYAKNGVILSFSASQYNQNSHLQYQYRLDGFEEDWSEWTRQSLKEYTNLDPGKYVFRVKARNVYGLEGKEARFAFSVATPWYATTVARVFWGGIILVLIAGFFWFTRKKAEREKEALRQEQARELERKELQYRNEAERSEAEIERLRNEKLTADIHHKNSELASATMHLVHKNEILSNIKSELKKILARDVLEDSSPVRQIIRTIDQDIHLDDTWEQFKVHFDQVHEDFFKRLKDKYPELTPKDQKLCAYLRMNLSTKEIAPLMNISVRGVEISRYRLRKKLMLESETNLVEFILDL